MSHQMADINLRPVNVDEALETLQTITRSMRERQDPRAVFPDVYGIITRNVKTAIENTENPVFLEPAWISRLAGRFCERYVAAFNNAGQGERGCNAWRIAFLDNVLHGCMPVENAVLGINAHINYDLAQGIYDNVIAHGARTDERLLARYRHDHDAVNEILEASIPEILDTLVQHYHCSSSRFCASSPVARRLVVRLTMQILQVWRSVVWNEMLDMLRMDHAADRSQVLARMDRRAHAIALAVFASSAVRRGVSRVLGTPRALLQAGPLSGSFRQAFAQV